VTNNNGAAEIVDMEDARRRFSDKRGAAYRDAGAWLAAAREASGLALGEAADKTHIKEQHLEAIEKLDLSALPARPYAIGFVRAYADFLGLPSDEVVERFKEDAGFAVSKPVESEKFEDVERAAPEEKPELSLLAMVAILAFVLWCVWQITLPREVRQIGEYAGASEQAVRAPSVTPAPAIAVNVVEARLVERVEPVYPISCLNEAAAVETVTVSFTITVQGRVSAERVANATNACFSEAALIALRRWRYEPRTVEGAPRAAYDQSVELAFNRPL
jgi:TonB family protein